jgi:hypothetical protein
MHIILDIYLEVQVVASFSKGTSQPQIHLLVPKQIM